jgi:predicted RNA-binding Zn ribbon-like protein
MSTRHDNLHEPDDQQDELFTAFVNTLEYTRGVPEEHLPDVDSLLLWLRDHELISGRARAAEGSRLRRQVGEAARRMQRFRRLRDVLRSLITDIVEAGQPNPAHIGELNHILRHGLHFHQLRHDPRGTRYTVAQLGDRLDQARATIASSFAHFLADGDPDRLRICDNDGCRYVFVDRSPTARRRWCDMRTCGNQAKVAAHRARQRATDAAEPAS